MELDALRGTQVQHLRQVPGDRLALAVGVGREDDLAVLLHRCPQLGDRLLPVLDDLVVRPEAGVDVDAKLLVGQVANVPHRGVHLEAVAQEALQCSRLRRRLDDDQTFRHSHSFIPNPGRSFRPGGSGRAILRSSFPPAQRP